MTGKGFAITRTEQTSSKIIKYKKLLLVLASIALVVLLIILSLCIINYNSAEEKAINAVALRMANNLPNSEYFYGCNFLSFDEFYSQIEFEDFEYYVELAGTVNVTYNGSKTDSLGFSARVVVSSLTGESWCSEAVIDGRHI